MNCCQHKKKIVIFNNKNIQLQLEGYVLTVLKALVWVPCYLYHFSLPNEKITFLKNN